MDRRRHRTAVAAAYAERRATAHAAEAALDARHHRLANLRLATAGVAVVLAVLALGMGRLSLVWLALPLVVFMALAVAHARLLAERTRVHRVISYLDDGLARLEGRWQGRGTTGLHHLPPDHPYADDLDIFGHGSVFDLLSTPRTLAGEATLARWLLQPGTPDDARARQQAAAELSGLDALREDLAVLGPDVPHAAATEALCAWATAPTSPAPVWAPVMLGALSAATLVGIGVWIASGEPPAWIGGVLGLQAIIGWTLRRHVVRVIHEVEPRARDLALTAALIARIDAETFAAPALVEIRRRLAASGLPASAEIRRLTRLVEWLTSRQNQIFGPISVLLFWATQLAWAVDRWRARAGRAVPDWIAALGELEALAALGTYAAEHPEAVFPTFVAGPPQVKARALMHPLLPPATAIGNDLSLGGDAPHLVIVSGSNMSGKSTWLRAVGVNVVFAHAGAPVCAAEMTLSPLLPAGTLRVQDSLQSGKSRFFAEITKLRQIVEQSRGTAQGTPATLFLIDELLAGTNSHDRRQGAEGVLRGLVTLGAIGMATTHDLALTDLATALGPRAANMHFADRFEDGGLEFDYHLREGVVGTSNAIALMRSVGLDV